MYRRFRIQIVVRVLALGATLALAVWLMIGTTSYVAAGLVVFAAGYQVAALVRYVERTNHDLSRLLRSIRYSDFSQSFSGAGRGTSFDELGTAFREVMDHFRAARAEKEESFRYLQTVMQHIGVGLISFQQDGTVNLINTAAKRLLRVPYLKNVQALEEFSPALVETLFRLRYGEKALVKIVDGDVLLHLAIYATEFRLRDEGFKLVSIQNIQSELEEKEIEAWQKLTRVLTHEIMNSVAPIASLASTAHSLLEDSASGLPENGTLADDLADARSAVAVIERRSEGLLHFVNDYRRLTRVPQPNFAITPVARLFAHVTELLGPQMADRGVRFTTAVVPEGLDLTLDAELIEQVLINLVKNAMEAAAGHEGAAVRLEARLDGRGHALVQVIDNGPGIVEEALDKIFIPFFTTKPDGSGIGLSLSREIMRQHGGTISATSRPGERTVFTLRF